MRDLVSRASTFMLLAMACDGAIAQERRQLDAHEHGHSTLNIAFEGAGLAMELMAPGADIVGFEHAAASESEKAAVAQAETILAQPLQLFAMPAGAGCRATMAEVEVEGEAGHADAAAAPKPADADSHSEFHARYALECADVKAVRTMDFAPFFERFPAAEEIEINVVAAGGQTAFEVERDDSSIALSF